jgi:hypothetical protein
LFASNILYISILFYIIIFIEELAQFLFLSGFVSLNEKLFSENLNTEAQINRYFREESPRLLSLSKQEDFGDFSKSSVVELVETRGLWRFFQI